MGMGLMGRRIVGLLGEGINEVIATTRNNAAPMGIINRGGELRMMLWKGSHTAQNVENDGWLVANFTHDPLIWVRSAFEDLEPEYFTDLEVQGRLMQRLSSCEAWIAFDVTITHQSTESLVIQLTSLDEEILTCTPRAVNRGFNSLIEATVHATRYMRTKDPALMALIDHHLGTVQRCGGGREREAMEILERYIKKIEIL